MTRSVAFFSVCIALCAVKTFAECGEETLSQEMWHGKTTSSGDVSQAATKGVSRQEHCQLSFRTTPKGPAVFQPRYSAAPVSSARGPNTVGTYYSFGADDVNMEVTAYNTSRTDYRQLGLLAGTTGPAWLGRFANTGIAVNPGDNFTASAAVNANTFVPAALVTSTGNKYEVQFSSCTYDTGLIQFYLNMALNREPTSCGAGNPCYIRHTYYASGSDIRSLTCEEVSDVGTGTVMQSIEWPTFSQIGSGNPGIYSVHCFRMQDVNSTTATPAIASRSIKYVIYGGDQSCSFSYEDTFNRNRCAKK
jgi:hypothetical protein